LAGDGALAFLCDGFADDAAVLAGAIKLVAGHITPAHRVRAQEVMAKVSRAFAR